MPDLVVQGGVLAIAATYVGKVVLELVRNRRLNGKNPNQEIVQKLTEVVTEIKTVDAKTERRHGEVVSKLECIATGMAGLAGFVQGSRRD